MTIPNAPAGTSPAASLPASPAVLPVPAPPSWPWRRAALFLAGAAQLIMISALVDADPLAVTWWSLLLVIAPALVAAAAAFAQPPVNRLAAAVGVLILVEAIAAESCTPGCYSSRRSWRWPSAA
jgi:hypothetical protein